MKLNFRKNEDRVLVVALMSVVLLVSVYYTQDLVKEKINNFVATLKQKAQSISIENKTEDEIIAKEEIKENKPKETVLLGKASVSYAGGIQNRNSNIELGVAKINGTVVKPNEEFSFLETLGPVLVENGFKEAKSFLNGEVILGLGGGLCHVSTTLFQSILDAGLLVTERHNHTFSVPFYEPGMDATISDLGPDLKFINNTSDDITIIGRTENKQAIFEIYGVDDGRVVTLTKAPLSHFSNFLPTKYIYDPSLGVNEKKCENDPTQGYRALINYIVTSDSGEQRDQVFNSYYKPMQRVCRVGLVDVEQFIGCTESTNYSPFTGMKCPDIFKQ